MLARTLPAHIPGNPTVIVQNQPGAGSLTMTKVSGAISAGPYPAELGTTLAPGQSEPVSFALTDQVENGPWNATLALRSGLVHESYHARITFPRTAGSSPPIRANPTSNENPIVIVVVAQVTRAARAKRLARLQ